MMHTVIQHTRARHVLTAALAGWALILMVAPAITARGRQKTANDGVYTDAQADRGEALFKEQCASCHAPADFTSDDFLKKWNGKQLNELFSTVSETMPMDNPGTLKPQQYADLVSYILKVNKFPAGQEELTSAADALKAISFAKPGL
jgi:mono/diheme cytochrome c family protein